MTLQQLRYFQILAEVKHFTKAANKVMVSQPSLSIAISELEAELGIPLFERSSRNVSLTKYGEFYLEYVDKILDLLDEAHENLEAMIDPNRGTISFAYVSSLEHFVPYLFSQYYFQQEEVYTKFQFHQLANADVKQWVLSGKADVGLGTFDNMDSLRYADIGTHELKLIVPADHPLAKQSSVNLKQLSDEKWVTYNEECNIRHYINRVLDEVNVVPKIVMEATQDPLIYSSVATNHGIALIPAPLGHRPYNVKVLDIENELPHRNVQLIWKETKHVSPAIEKFCRFVSSQSNILAEFRNSPPQL